MVLLLPALLAVGMVACTSSPPVANNAPATTHPGSTLNPNLPALDAIIQQGIDDKLYPGAVCIVGEIRNGQHTLLHTNAYGHLTYPHHNPNAQPTQLNTLYDLASLTKVVATTTATLLNVADSRLDLDDPAAQHLPGFGRHGKDAITLRHLLTHTSGLKPYEDCAVVEAGRRDNETHSDALQRHYAGLPLAYETGTDYRYSCLNFQTLARINEYAAGEPLEALLVRRVFAPLGMHDTRYTLTDEQRARTAPTFRDANGNPAPGTTHDPLARYHQSTPHNPGNAGLYSTAPDLARYCQLILQLGSYDGQQILHPKLLAHALNPQIHNDDIHEQRGLGFDIYESQHYITEHNTQPGHELVGHTGYTGTLILIDQHTRRYLILLTNRTYPAEAAATDQTPSINTIRRACWQAVRELPRGSEPGVESAFEPQVDVTVDGSECSAFVFDPKTDSFWGIVSEFEEHSDNPELLLFTHKVCRVRDSCGRVSLSVLAEIREELSWSAYSVIYEHDPQIYIASLVDEGPLIVSPGLGVLLPVSDGEGGRLTYQRAAQIDRVPLAVSRHQGQTRCYSAREDMLITTTVAGSVISQSSLVHVPLYEDFDSDRAGILSHLLQPRHAAYENTETLAIADFGGILLVDGVTGDVLTPVSPRAGVLDYVYYSDVFDAAVFQTVHIRGRRPINTPEPGLFLTQACLSGGDDSVRIRVPQGADLGRVLDCVFHGNPDGAGLESVSLFTTSGHWHVTPNGVARLLASFPTNRSLPGLIDVCIGSYLSEVLFIHRERTGEMRFMIRDMSASISPRDFP